MRLKIDFFFFFSQTTLQQLLDLQSVAAWQPVWPLTADWRGNATLWYVFLYDTPQNHLTALY